MDEVIDPGMAPDQAELFRIMVASATGFAIFSTDSNGMVTSWNIGAERLLGYAEAEIVGCSVDVIFTPEDRAAGVPDAERATAASQGRTEDERWHVRRDGSRLWGSGLQMPFSGERTGFFKILRDMTDRHTAEKRLRDSEDMFRVLATNIPQMVFKTLAGGDRTWGSAQWIEFTGFDLDKSVGFGWLDAIHPEDREASLKAWRDADDTGTYLVEHRTFQIATGEWRWHLTQARPIDDPAGEWVGTSTDIHDLRELHDRQAVLLAELQHRTRNLLAVVQSMARQSLRRSSSLQGFEGEFTRRLGALSRVQGLLASTDTYALDLRNLIEAELAAHHGGEAGTGDVVIEGAMAIIPAESAQAVALALHELTTNAVKYGALAQPSGRLEITWQPDLPDTSRIVLDWRERGVVMPDEDQRRKGYGSELIERALPYQLKTITKLEFGPDGVRCQITVPVAPREKAPFHG